MSEKIYAWLLHLYPTRFRSLYGSEALQLVRDRARDEPGLWKKIRLWADIITDLLGSLPREHVKVNAADALATAEELARKKVQAHPWLR